MDLKQLEYIVAIAESKSVTEAAQKLFISQSGLNQQLMKLEKELGVQLFERGKRHFQITRAGEIYVQNAREILKIRRNTYALLNDIRQDLSGEINLGLTLEHGIDLFTAIYPEFHERYPNIRFNLLECHVYDQKKLIREGRLDSGVVMFKEQEKEDGLVYDTLLEEDLLLGIPLSHPYASYGGDPRDPLPYIDLKYFEKDSFSLIFASSTMREVIAPLFQKAGYSPRILMETGMNHALIQMVSKGFYCTILPHCRALSNPLSKNCVWFRLLGDSRWKVYLARRPDTEFGSAYAYFKELALSYGEVLMAQFHLEEKGEVVVPEG